MFYLHDSSCVYVIKKILHTVIAALILVSSTGFTINMHYCHDQLIDIALNSPAHSCCESNTKSLCHSGHEKDGFNKKNHCQNESIIVEPADDYEVSASSFSYEKVHFTPLFFMAALSSHQGIQEPVKHEVPWYKRPPTYQEVVLSKIQSYLI